MSTAAQKMVESQKKIPSVIKNFFSGKKTVITLGL